MHLVPNLPDEEFLSAMVLLYIEQQLREAEKKRAALYLPNVTYEMREHVNQIMCLPQKCKDKRAVITMESVPCAAAQGQHESAAQWK